jgi:hypothetical protein
MEDRAPLVQPLIQADGSGPITYREAVVTFATKPEIIERFADLRASIEQWRADQAKVTDDHEKRLRSMEARQLPIWATAILVGPVFTAILHWLVPK